MFFHFCQVFQQFSHDCRVNCQLRKAERRLLLKEAHLAASQRGEAAKNEGLKALQAQLSEVLFELDRRAAKLLLKRLGHQGLLCGKYCVYCIYLYLYKGIWLRCSFSFASPPPACLSGSTTRGHPRCVVFFASGKPFLPPVLRYRCRLIGRFRHLVFHCWFICFLVSQHHNSPGWLSLHFTVPTVKFYNSQLAFGFISQILFRDQCCAWFEIDLHLTITSGFGLCLTDGFLHIACAGFGLTLSPLLHRELYYLHVLLLLPVHAPYYFCDRPFLQRTGGD